MKKITLLEAVKHDAEIEKAITQILGVNNLEVMPLHGGVNERTFLLSSEKQDWALRVEPSKSVNGSEDGFQLRKSFQAQSMAKEIGVRVPSIVCHNFDQRKEVDLLWMIEEKVEGVAFDNQLSESESELASIDLGEQLRLLHTKEFDGTAPYPYDCYESWIKADKEEYALFEELFGPQHALFVDCMDREKEKVEYAISESGADNISLHEIFELYDTLATSYHDKRRFCHGDTAGGNILVDNGKCTIIDWEWSGGNDPARNVAAWSFWNTHNPDLLDVFLRGYNPDDLLSFKKRVRMYEVPDAISTILSYGDQGNQKGVKSTGKRLKELMDQRLWEKC
jgi:aminoglycoside phosphotransferase (APT) family kinase protein